MRSWSQQGSRMIATKMLSFCLAIVFMSESTGGCQESREADYYRLESIPIPEDVVLEVGGLQFLPDGRLAVCTRRGDIYMVSNPLSEDPQQVSMSRWLRGLHEPLGLAYRDGWLYVTQRGEVTRLRDADADGLADEVQAVADDWGMSGDYHEYTFGSKFDADGNLWLVLCLTGSFTSEAPFRGWCLRVTPEGDVIPTCSGLRSPGGIGMNLAGDMFYTENQGPWNGTCSLKWLRPGSFQGHPIGNDWYRLTDAIGPEPEEPQDGSRTMKEAARIPELEPPAVLFPYKKMGQSAAGIACDTSNGKFGPFAGQLFVGDQTFSTVMRVDLETVDGHYQGACFPFREGFDCGSVALEFAPDGSLFVGGTNRGWGSRGTQPYSLERLVWTGKIPFEVHTLRIRPDGFRLTLTQPVDPEVASDPAAYRLSTYTYIYQSGYGSPEVDHTTPTIKSARVSPDGYSVDLVVDGLQIGHVHEFDLFGLRNARGEPLLHPEAYYTLNYLPSVEIDKFGTRDLNPD